MHNKGGIMLRFIKSDHDEICHTLTDATDREREAVMKASEGKREIYYSTVDGSCIYKLTDDNGSVKFTFPTGENRREVIALLVTYTREYYLPISFTYVARDDVNSLLAMFPNYDFTLSPVGNKADGFYDIDL